MFKVFLKWHTNTKYTIKNLHWKFEMLHPRYLKYKKNNIIDAFKVLCDSTFTIVMKIFINHCSIISWNIFGSVDQIEENKENLDLPFNYETIIPKLNRNSNWYAKNKQLGILKGGIWV